MTLNLTDYIYVIAGLVYVLFIVLQKRTSTFSLILNTTTLSLIFFRNSTTYYPILAMISVLQALSASNERAHLTAAKYLVYSFLFLVCGSILAQGFQRDILFILIALKTLLAETDLETENAKFLHPNMFIALSALLNNQATQNTSTLNTILMVVLALACIRSMFNKDMRTPIYIGQIFLIAASINPVYSVCIYLYLSIIHSIPRPKDVADNLLVIIPICLPFIDGTLFQSSIPSLDQKWGEPILAGLTGISLSFYMEQALANNKKFKLKMPQIFITLCFLLLISFNLIWGSRSPIINRPVPLFSVMILILVNTFYLRISSRSKIGELLKDIKIIKLKKHAANNRPVEQEIDKNYLDSNHAESLIFRSSTGSIIIFLLILISLTLIIYGWSI